MLKLEEKSIFQVNIFYLLTGILLLFVGSIAQTIEIYSGLLITEYILVLIPSVLYIKIKGLPIKKTLKLNKISFKQILYIIGISIFTYPIAVFINFIVLTILMSFGEISADAVPIPDNSTLFLFSLFVIAISPAICEEVMFRGVIMNQYEKISKRKAIIYSAILFGVFHVNIQNLVGPVLLGIIFGITVYKTNSIYASIIGHAINNGIALTLGYFVTKSESFLAQTEAIDIPTDGMFYQLQLFMNFMIIGGLAFLSYKILKSLIIGLPLSEEGEFISLKDPKVEQLVEEKTYNFEIFHFIPLAIFFALFLYINMRFTYI